MSRNARAMQYNTVVKGEVGSRILGNRAVLCYAGTQRAREPDRSANAANDTKPALSRLFTKQAQPIAHHSSTIL